MKKRQAKNESEEEDYSSEEEILMSNSFLANADPRDITIVSEEIQDIFNRASDKYYQVEKTDHVQLEYGDDDLFPVQYAVANTFIKTKGITSFFAEPGTGKTLTAIAVVSYCRKCLILVPNSVLNQWISFLEDYGMYNVRDPEESQVLVYSAGLADKHRKYLTNATAEELAGRDSLIILAAHHNIASHKEVPGVVSFFNRNTIAGEEFTIIVDEAHVSIRDMEAWIQPMIQKGLATRELLMSGSELTPKILKNNGVNKIDHVINVWKTNEMPTDEWHVELMNSPSFTKDEKEWVKKTKEIVAKNTKIVIVCEADARDMLILAKIFGRKRVYIKKTQKNVVRDFNSDEEAILFLPALQKVGLNINADSMIIFNPGKITTERLIQVSKRIIRPNNPNRHVNLYMLCGTPKEFYRVLYAKAFSISQWKFGRENEVNVGMVYKGISTIRMLGYPNPQVIDRVDLCVFLANYPELEDEGKLTNTYEQILEWWEENKLESTILTAGDIRNMIVL